MAISLKRTNIPSSKGDISAVIHYPESKTGKLAILCAGYLDSKDYRHLTSLAEELAKTGYVVVRFDPTGTWESDGDISDYNTTQYLDDIKHVLNFMMKEGDYNHVLLGGHSRGGQLSILYAARDPRISLVLSIMPSSKRTTKMGSRYIEWQNTGFTVSRRDNPNGEGEVEFKVPFSHAIDKDKYDVVEDVKKVKVPIVFMAGELDIECPTEIVKEIFDEANEPKQFIVLSGIGHNYRKNEDDIRIVNKEILNKINH